MSRSLRWWAALLVVNVALPFGFALVIPSDKTLWQYWAIFLNGIVILFVLNKFIAASFKRRRGWVWGVQALNLLSSALAGCWSFTQLIPPLVPILLEPLL